MGEILTPIEGESFSDYWKRQYWANSGTFDNGLASDDPNSIFSRISNFIGGEVDTARERYNQWYDEQSAARKAQLDYEYTRLMNSTKYVDEVKALRDAGLNPYAILAGNGLSAGNMSYASYEAPMKGKTKAADNGKALGAIAILIAAVLKAVL